MSVDKFGRHENSIVREILRGPPGEGFSLTQDGHYDLKRKRVCNLGDAVHSEEAVNLKTVCSLTLNCETSDKMFDAKNKRIKNIASPENDSDAVNRIYLFQKLNQLKKDINNQISKLSYDVLSVNYPKGKVNKAHLDDNIDNNILTHETEEPFITLANV